MMATIPPIRISSPFGIMPQFDILQHQTDLDTVTGKRLPHHEGLVQPLHDSPVQSL